jgi:pimeloyl-ACP methyl ester carboxylesterase
MDLPEGWTTDTVRANGVDLRYYRTGSGPPVVLAHGFYENGRVWTPLAEALAGEYTVVAYDARGHGRSDAPETGYAMDDRTADLVGHSMGGATVAWTAAAHPDLPRAVVMVEPAGMLGDPSMGPEERVEVVRERVDDWADRPVEDIAGEYDDWDPDDARRTAAANAECSPLIAEIAREGYPTAVEAFPDVTCPALVVNADPDPEERARERGAADELPDGRLVRRTRSPPH